MNLMLASTSFVKAPRITLGELAVNASSRISSTSILLGGGAVLALASPWWLPAVAVVSYLSGFVSNRLAQGAMNREQTVLDKSNLRGGPFDMHFEMADSEQAMTKMRSSTTRTLSRSPFFSAVRGVNAGKPSPEVLLDLLEWNAKKQILRIDLRVNLLGHHYQVASSLLAMPRPRALRLLRCVIELHALLSMSDIPQDLCTELRFLAQSVREQFTVVFTPVAVDHERLARLRLMVEALPA